MISSQELIILVTVVILLLLLVLFSSSGRRHRYRFPTDQEYELDHTNMRHTNLNGRRMHSQRLPSPYYGGVSEFMNARYKVIVDDNIGDNTEPLNDLCIMGFGNPYADILDKMPNAGRIAQWDVEKSTPTIAGDDKQLEHVAAEMQTPNFQVRKSGKTRHLLPHTGGKSRLNFSSFENSNSESPFRQ
jgi:hypothetical protein